GIDREGLGTQSGHALKPCACGLSDFPHGLLIEIVCVAKRDKYTDHAGLANEVRVAGFTVSEQGTLAYEREGNTERHLLWFDRSGKQLGEAGPPSMYNAFALSPDHQRVAVTDHDDLWLVDLVRGGISRFTFQPASEGTPAWSPDGNRIVYQSNRAGGSFDLYVKASNGGQEELLVKSNGSKYA